jgi:hydrogenase-1 operon protein HyaF
MDFRANPLRWNEDEIEAPSGIFLNDGSDAPVLLDLPSGLRAPRRRMLREEAGPGAAAFLREVAAALRSRAESAPAQRLPLNDLTEADRAAVEDLLGEGEVHLVFGDGSVQAFESVMTGVWRVHETRPEGTVDTIDVSDVPAATRAALAACRAAVPLLTPEAEGVMNAPALLAEVAHRAAVWRPGEANHVISLTLLPISEADQAALHGALGGGPVIATAQGYGSVRVTATACRHVWSVQYLNARDAIILDTLEIGDVPAAIRAAAEDFEDSAQRLDAVMETFAP